MMWPKRRLVEVVIACVIIWLVSPVYAVIPPLHTDGNSIKDPCGNVVVLRGISLIDLGFLQDWQGGAINMIDRLTNKSNAEGNSPGWYPKVIRIPIAPPDAASGWPHPFNPNNTDLYNLLRTVVDYCATKDMYVIIDWHYIDNTYSHVASTSEFWNYMAPRFANDKHVMFELFNEPINNTFGSETNNWLSVRSDMHTWINIVRSYAPNNIILVGAPNWCQAIGPAASYPVTGDNIVIVSHIYPGHWQNPGWFTGHINTCLTRYPILMTEWGFTSSGDSLLIGTITGYGQPLMDFREARKIGHTAWVASYDWGPPMFYNNWTLRIGESEMGGFTKDKLYEKRDSDQPVAADAEPPAAPTGLTAIPGNSTVTLDWNDNSESDLYGYDIYRSTSSGSGYTRINLVRTKNSNYTDSNAAGGLTYYYIVTAVDTSYNESPDSNVVSATPTDTIAPAAPTGLLAMPGNQTVSLNWNDNGEGDLDGYNVYRSTTSGSGYAKINSPLVSVSDYNDTTVVNGTTYYYVVTAVDGSSNESGYSIQSSATPSITGGQDPYPGPNSTPIPGRIQAENYDTGGEGVAYHDDTSGNSGNQYRTENVDIETCGEGGYNVGWIAAGEWLEYTVNVASSGTYNVTARVASSSTGGSLHIELGGVNVTGTINLASTGGWQNWTSVYDTDVVLNAGPQIMRISMDLSGWNLNWVEFTFTGGSNPQNCAEVYAQGYGLQSDLDGDCYVGYVELEVLAYYWLYADCVAFNNCDGTDFEPADGVVNLFDFSVFAGQWLMCNNPEDPSCSQNW